MFGIGSSELLVILVVALLVLGPKNLPKIAQTLGRAMGEFRKVSTEFQRTLNTEIAFEEEAEKQKVKKTEEKPAEAQTTEKVAEPVIDTTAQAEDSNAATVASGEPSGTAATTVADASKTDTGEKA